MRAVAEAFLCKIFNEGLAAVLTPAYTTPNIGGGHEYTHVQRLVALGPKIKSALGLAFDMDEFVSAVWLHNLDRAKSLKESIKAAGSVENYARQLLAESPFDFEARERIIDAVVQHNKKDDEPNDSPLLTALRVADKLDRFGPLGIMAACAFRGGDLLPYDPRLPFGYQSTAENKLKTLYNDFFRILEWYAMLPSNHARGLVNSNRLRFFIEFLRMLGEEIAEVTGLENHVEQDIRKALGSYYDSVVGYLLDGKKPYE